MPVMDDKINLSLDDIIRKSKLCHPKLDNSSTFIQNERGRSRSRTRSPYKGQQWRLERGRQQNLTDSPPQRSRSRSRSRESHRSSSSVPFLPSVSYIEPRSRSLPRQNYSYYNQKRVSMQNTRWRSGLGFNIRKYSLGFSPRSTAVFRPTSSLHQLRIAKKRVQIAKNILNARHQSYLRQLRQYRHEMLEDSFKVPHYRLKNVQKFPGLFPKTHYHNIFHNRTAMQRVHAEGTLSVTFENELASCSSCTHTAEGGTVPLGFKPSEASTASPQSVMNGYLIQNPSIENSTNDDVYMSTNANVKQSVATDALPVLVSSTECPRLLYKPNEYNMGKKRMVHPTRTVRTLNERFSNYRVVCL